MDIQRNLLIVALILVSGFILIDWVQYRAEHAPAAVAASAAAPQRRPPMPTR